MFFLRKFSPFSCDIQITSITLSLEFSIRANHILELFPHAYNTDIPINYEV